MVEKSRFLNLDVSYLPIDQAKRLKHNGLKSHIITWNFLCTGQFGLVFKEWETITSTYPETARRLNLVTKQVDIDIYYDLGGKMEVKNIDDPDGIILKIPRMKKKKPELVDFDTSLVKSGT